MVNQTTTLTPTKPEAVDVLRAVRAKITPKHQWTKDWFAKTGNGHNCDPLSPDACCWCWRGALRLVCNSNVLRAEVDFFMEQATGSTVIASWQDDHTHEEVLAATDRAIELAVAHYKRCFNAEVVDVLRDVRFKLTPPENWTTKWYAKDKNGEDVASRSPKATCWCWRGALIAVCRSFQVRKKAHEYMIQVIGTRRIASWQDHQTHAQVLEATDKAIELALADSK